MTILDKLCGHALERVEAAKRNLPVCEIRKKALSLPKGDFRFEAALSGPDIAFICECKKASPSKGLIAPDFDCVSIARAYEDAGAEAISVLTEPKWFLGSDEYLEKVAQTVSVPCLRKDFTVDEYMLYEAKLLGAGAALLICAICDSARLKDYIAVCDELGLTALTECHDESEIETALGAGARVVGVNNRNLKDFSVDTSNSARLRSLVPKDVVFVSESGVKSAGDVSALARAGVSAVLIGEALMLAEDKRAKLKELRGEK